MPVFDTPINTNDFSIDRVVGQKLPILMYLYRQPNAEIDAVLSEMAKKHAGKLLVVRLHAGENPQTYARYKSLALPALVGLKSNEIQVQTAGVKPADVSAHAAYLLGEGPKPAQPAPTAEPVKSDSAKSNGTKASSAKPANVTDSSFAKEVLKSKIPVLVDFWAPWCGPCHMVAPSVEKMAEKYAGQVKVVKVNVDDSPQTASRYQTFSIPTLILFKDGKEFNRLVGAHPLPAIDRLVQSALPQKHPAK